MSGYTYSITATLLVDSATAQSHTIIATYFGDGDSCSTSISPASVNSKVLKYIWSCVHTYSGPGDYKLYLTDKFRISGIKNITNSNSKPIYVESSLSINQFMGPNNSVVFINQPIFFINKGTLLFYNPAASDFDGDSLSYSLINCAITPTAAYYIPLNSGINTATGTFTYQADTSGIYAFNIEIKEWRKDGDGVYQNIGFTDVDFVVDILPSSVGIKEFDKNEWIKIYPNPVSNALNIKFDSKHNSSIEIINYLGQTVLKQNYSESIDVSKLESGYYILKIIGEKNYYSKFIKE
ncbi:MAG TPA: T9SS type A sorting domain-containing protein [Bacteroidia bacterium]|nr:T9SS type A sorting domain-containing protein [Bacteroidia bacterium]